LAGVHILASTYFGEYHGVEGILNFQTQPLDKDALRKKNLIVS
jgi:hypothetical protein